jgi:polyisoprenoid-binding protein YceI
MRNRVTLSFIAFAILFVASGSAFAHHGAAAYDSAKMVTVTGTVTDFQFVNPHVMISMDVKDPSTGKIEKWEGELTSPNHLERAGWTKSTIKVGDQVTMTGAALKSGALAMAIRKVMKNGQEIRLMGGSDN